MSSCDELGQLLQEFADGEIDDLGKCLVEAHLFDCRICATELEKIYQLRELLASGDMRYAAPRHLRKRVEHSLATPHARAAWKLASWLLPAATGALAASLVALITPFSQVDAPIEQDLVANHVRSLQANHLVDVSATNQYSVGPWFNGRIDFAPHAPKIGAAQFRLLGCRLDYARGRALAALVYARADHKVNLFVWPAQMQGDKVLERDGYSIVEWSNGGLRYAAVSDAPPSDLLQLRAGFSKEQPLDG